MIDLETRCQDIVEQLRAEQTARREARRDRQERVALICAAALGILGCAMLAYVLTAVGR